ncbi:hypothetical protein D1007_31359 [Hordeum vulgare]|nr:hypothetical protein D1007_31359 [Hordeum vulgare]
MAWSSSSSFFHSSGTTTTLATVKVEPQETLERRRSHGGNLVTNEGRRQPSPPRGHLRLVRPKKESVTSLVVKQEHAKMDVDLVTGMKWSRDDYVREEMERQRQRCALEEIVARRRDHKEDGVIVLSDDEEETPV